MFSMAKLLDGVHFIIPENETELKYDDIKVE